MNQVLFVPRTTAEVVGPFARWAVISITDPYMEKVIFRPGWYAVLRLAFFDLIVSEPPLDVMVREDAFRIVDFVHQHAESIDTLMIHCKGGISRSAAIAKWVAITFDIPFNHQYQSFNTHVFNLLKESEKQWQLSHG